MTYTKRLLASRYFPEASNIDSAMRRLRREIQGCEPLYDALMASGYKPNGHSFTIRQVNMIFDFLGEPKK